jgi:hypothetical protein
MGGDERVQDGMFSYVSLERRVPADHLLRGVRELTDTVLRSERLLVEKIDYNLLFRWFVGLGMDDAVWNHHPIPQRES